MMDQTHPPQTFSGGPQGRVPSPLQKCPLLQFVIRLLQLRLSIHDDRPIPRHRLLQRLSRNQQKPNAILPRLNLNPISASKQHQRPIIRFRRRRDVSPAQAFRRHCQRRRRITKFPTPPQTRKQKRGSWFPHEELSDVPAEPRRRDTSDQPRCLRPGRACPRSGRRSNAHACRRHP